MTSELVIVRGAGDLATGVIQKLWRAGFSVLALETENPTTIRRNVALSSAVGHGQQSVEDMVARKAETLDDLPAIWADGEIPILVDPQGESIAALEPLAVVDAIIAKRNLGTHREMAPITVALGPGFSAPEDVDAVIETMRGHRLGRLILQGQAAANTGVPGLVGGEAALRVIHAPVAGRVRHQTTLGDTVEKGQILFTIDDTPVPSPLTGILRGLIEEDTDVRQGLKVADVDPRLEVKEYYHLISDKARNLGGAVLEAILYLKNTCEPLP